MNPEQYQFIKKILNEVYELDREEQKSHIETSCQSCPELIPTLMQMLELADSEQSRKMEKPVIEDHVISNYPDQNKEEGVLPAGTQINHYVIIEQIGAGGMGNVYSAQQKYPAERKVAIKLLKLKPNQQFLISETQILAQLNHPNIATLYEIGKTEDEQYFIAMELIEGEDILIWCNERKYNIKTRIGLFQQLCLGISYAHEKGIIHCDIKPNNVLVTEVDGKALVKIIDFGISRLESQNHDSGEIAGTPAYLAPEVLTNMEIASTRRDVYSLGVLLKKLLPLPVSADLKSIIEKATAYKKQDRYASPTSLNFDLNRYLNKKPVRAYTSNWLYVFKLFIQRNFVVVAFSAILLLSLIGGFIAQYNQAELAKKQSIAARLAQKEAEEVSDFLTDMFNVANPQRSTGNILTAGDLIHRAKLKLNSIESPTLSDARFMHTIGTIYTHMEKLTDAQEMIEASLRIKEKFLDKNDSAVIQERIQLGLIYKKMGNMEESEKLITDSLEALNKQKSGNLDQKSKCYNTLGNIYISREQFEKAKQQHEAAIEIRKQLNDKLALAESYNNLGVIYSNQKNWNQAAKYYYLALDIYSKEYDENHPYIGTLKNNLAIIEEQKFNWKKSEDLLSEAWIIWQFAYGEIHSNTITAKRNLALFYDRRMQFDRAIQLYDLMISGFIETHDEEKQARYTSLKARSYAQKGDFDKANQLHQQALNLVKNIELNEKYLYIRLRTQYAQTLIEQGEYIHAIEFLDEAQHYAEGKYSINNQMRLYSLNIMADAYFRNGDNENASGIYNEVISLIPSVKSKSIDQIRQINALIGLAKIYRNQAEFEKPLQFLNNALTLNQSLYGDMHKTNGIIYYEMGQLFAKHNNTADAQKYLQKAIEIQKITLPEKHPDLLKTQNLITLFRSQKDK